MIIKKQLAALILLLVFSPIVVAEDLMQVYLHAQANDAQIKASEAGYLALLEQKPQALSALKPQITLNANASFSGQYSGRKARGSDDLSSFLSLGYTLNLTKPLYRKAINLSVDRANLSVLQAQSSLGLERQALILRVAEAYLNFLKAQDSTQFSRLETISIGRKFSQVKAYFNAGRSPITDVKEAKARYDSARSREIVAIQNINISREVLKSISGHYYRDLLGAAEGIPLRLPKPSNIQSWAKAALLYNKEIHIAKYAVLQAQSVVDLSRSEKTPTVDIFARQTGTSAFGESAFNQDKFDATVGVQLNVPLYTGGNLASKVREARHKLQQKRYQLESKKRAIIQQTRAAYLAAVAGIAQANALEQALHSTQIAAKATKTGFQVGTRTAVDVLLSLRETFRSQRDYSNARYGFLLNTVKLKKAAGTLSVIDIKNLSNLLTRPQSSTVKVTKYK